MAVLKITHVKNSKTSMVTLNYKSHSGNAGSYFQNLMYRYFNVKNTVRSVLGDTEEKELLVDGFNMSENTSRARMCHK